MKSKRSKDDIRAIKSDLCGVWGQMKMRPEGNPMTTREVFSIMGFDYNDVSDRETLYRIISNCQKEAEVLWDQFDIEGGNKEKVFKMWLDYCWLNKKPYILFVEGEAYTPKNYAEWERLLETNLLSSLNGMMTSIGRMTSKSMKLLKSKYFEAKGLLTAGNDDLKKLE